MKLCGFCRVCGRIERLHHLQEKEKDLLTFIWSYEIFSCDKHMICSACGSSLKIHHSKNYTYRNKGGYRKKGHTISVWNEVKNCPLLNSLGKIKKLKFCKKGKKWIVEAEDNDLTEIPPLPPQRMTISLRQSTRPKNVKKQLDQKIQEAKNIGLKDFDAGLKGRGVKTTKPFKKGEYVTTYVGKLMYAKEAKILNKQNYLLYFSINQKHYCINSNDELESYGLARLMNHSRKNPNLKANVKLINGLPFAYFTAKHDIPDDTELLWDYGDKNTDVEWMNTT